MQRTWKKFLFLTVLGTSALLAACDGNVGVGLSIGIPIGNHGYMSVGGTRWR